MNWGKKLTKKRASVFKPNFSVYQNEIMFFFVIIEFKFAKSCKFLKKNEPEDSYSQRDYN